MEHLRREQNDYVENEWANNNGKLWKYAVNFVNEYLTSKNSEMKKLQEEQKSILKKYDLNQYSFSAIASEKDWDRFNELQKEIDSIRGQKVEYVEG